MAEIGDFETRCEKCGHDGVELYSCVVHPIGVRIMRDGFSLQDAKQVETDDENVRCPKCGHIGPLRYIEEESDGKEGVY